MVLVPSQDKGVGGNRGPLRGNLGGQWRVRAQEPQSLPVRRRWHRVNSGKDPEEVQVAARHRVERLENALQALGETESTVAQGLNAALKEVRRAAQGRYLVVQLTECQGFIQRSKHRQMEEKRGTEGIGWSSRAFVQVVRRDGEKSRSSTQCEEPSGDTARTDPCRSSLCRGPPVESEVGRGGVRTRCSGEEARPFFVGAFSDVLQANQWTVNQ